MHVMIDQFVQQIVASGLMTAEQLAAATAEIPAEQKPRNSEELGRELVRRKKLTPYQAKEIYYGRGRLLILGNYVILDKLGQGGMGLVLKAEHRRMERLVALKVLSPKFVRNPDSLRRFQREVKAAARLMHPNIVTAYDADDADGMHFLVMEYVEGCDLAVLVRQQGRMPLALALDCIVQAAVGLRYAHEHGVVHRDIKPANLLLDRQRSIKILDMGLARLDKTDPEQDELTGSGQIIGTVDYMAPEQATSTKDADERADIYSLGVTLWHLLTGCPMYPGDAPVQKLLAHQNQPIPSLCGVCPEASSALEAVFCRMVAKTPQERYQTMAEVIAALEPFRGGAATVDSPVVENTKLDAFLRGIGTAPISHRPGSSSRQRLPAETREPKAEPASEPGHASVAATEATVEWFERQADTNARTEQSSSGSASDRAAVVPWWLDGKKLAVCGAGALALATVALVVVAVLLRPNPAILELPSVVNEPSIAQENPVAVPFDDVVPSEPRQPDRARLVLHWPPSEWADSRLEIDGQVYDPVELADPQVPDGLSVPLEPGERRIWVARRGFEPFEQTVQLAPGQQVTVMLKWQSLSMPRQIQELDAMEVPGIQPDDVQAEMGVKPSELPSSPETTNQGEAGHVAVPKPDSFVGPAPDELAAFEALEAAEAAWREATKASEEKARSWDFVGAAAALDDVRFDDQPTTIRLKKRKNELDFMADLKQRMIGRINAADPPLTKRDLALRGTGGEVANADQQGITAVLPGGKNELLAWNDLGSQAPVRLLQLVVNPAEPDDWLRAGVFAMGVDDVELAERMLARASEMGVDVQPYRDPLAQVELDAARELLEAGSYVKAAESFKALESKYADTTWFSTRRAAVAAARSVAEHGVREAKAENLYAQAADYFEKEQLFDVHPLVVTLRNEFAGTSAVIDTTRKPSFAELEAAVTQLGKIFTVRQDGKGDFTKIQAAVDAALPNSLIEIQDSGLYREQISIETDGLTLRGRRGHWPIITSAGFPAAIERLIRVSAHDVQLEQFVVAHTNVGGGEPHGIDLRGSRGCRVVRVIVACEGISLHSGQDTRVDTAFVTGFMPGSFHVANSQCLHRTMAAFAENSVLGTWELSGENCEAHRCVIHERVFLRPGSVLTDSIVRSVQSADPNVRIEFCNVHGGNAHGDPPFIDRARPGKGCFSAPPMFVAPNNADYRLMPNSPRIGKASDNGDVGVRFTPDMLEIQKQALELRTRGIIKF